MPRAITRQRRQTLHSRTKERQMKPYGSRSHFRVALFLLAASLLALPRIVQAQDVDPPSSVARLNFIEGSVSFQPAGESEWVTANPNRPLTTGDQLWADQGSRGELHLGGAVLRLSSETAVSFLNLTDRRFKFRWRKALRRCACAIWKTTRATSLILRIWLFPFCARGSIAWM